MSVHEKLLLMAVCALFVLCMVTIWRRAGHINRRLDEESGRNSLRRLNRFQLR